MIHATLMNTRKEVHHGVRFAEFEYKYIHDGGVGINKDHEGDAFEILTIDHELQLIWIVECLFPQNANNKDKKDLVWKRVILDHCPENVFGSIFVHASCTDCTFVDKFYSSHNTFDLKKINKKQIRCITSLDTIHFKVQIYLQDNRLESMIQDYDKLLTTKSYSDILFVIGKNKQEIPAHRVIVAARSDVFSAMFECDMRETESSRIEIDDIEPEIFKKMLTFMYSGKVDFTANMYHLMNLIIVAHKYKVDSLREVCSYRLSSNINVNNVVDVLVVADLIQDEVLKRNCLFFIINHKESIVRSPSFHSMVEAGKADLLSEILYLISSVEISYSKFLGRYLSKGNKQKDFPNQTKPSTSLEASETANAIAEDNKLSMSEN